MEASKGLCNFFIDFYIINRIFLFVFILHQLLIFNSKYTINKKIKTIIYATSEYLIIDFYEICEMDKNYIPEVWVYYPEKYIHQYKLKFTCQ